MFKWKALGMGITSTLQEVDPPHTIGWTGDSLGMHAVHVWHLESSNGKTKVTTEESLSGWFPKILKFFNPNFLDQSLQKSLETLKATAEQE